MNGKANGMIAAPSGAQSSTIAAAGGAVSGRSNTGGVNGVDGTNGKGTNGAQNGQVKRGPTENGDDHPSKRQKGPGGLDVVPSREIYWMMEDERARRW